MSSAARPPHCGREVVESDVPLSTADEIAQQGRVRALAALMGGDASELEQRPSVLVVEGELLGWDRSRLRESVAGGGEPLVHALDRTRLVDQDPTSSYSSCRRHHWYGLVWG